MTSAFAKNNNLQSISYVKFGLGSDNKADGSVMSGVTSGDWDTKITNNSQLWDSITTVMNSLAYNQSLNNSSNDNGMNANNGKWPQTAGTPAWYQTDLNTDGSSLKGANKWWNTLANVGSTSSGADAELKFDLSTTDNTPKSVYFKHNGVIWEWTQTKSGETVSITLSTHSSTIPNIYKGTKMVTGDTPNSGSAAKPADTAYTFKTWTKPENSNLEGKDCGVSFTFKITG